MSAIAATSPPSDSIVQLHPRLTKSDPSKISEIEDLAHRVHADIRFALNGFASINKRLPPEVLGVIPSFLVRDRDRIVATHVCRHWRNTFLSTPFLWNRIRAFQHPEKTEAYLERSRDTPLDIYIASHKIWSQGGTTPLQRLEPLSNRCRTARLLQNLHDEDVLGIIRNPCPRLLELNLEIAHGRSFHGIEDLSNFPSLKSLTLGDIRHLRFSKPFNLRKLGIGLSGERSRLSPLLEFLEKIPLLEELEITTPVVPPTTFEAEDAPTPVVLKSLQRLVFRGVRSDLPYLLSRLITHPKDTKIILTRYLPYDAIEHPPVNPRFHMFPPGMRLPTSSPPKFVRYRDIQDDDSPEARFCIDLISVDGQHTSIENRYGWRDEPPFHRPRPFISEDAHTQCLGFISTLNLSLVERFCIERCTSYPPIVWEVMKKMVNLGTLVVVNSYPYGAFIGLEVQEPPAVSCPGLRRLVVRQDLTIYMHLHTLLPIVEGRAARGCPLEQVVLTSSFNEPFEDPGRFIAVFGGIAEVTCDFGRNTYGWEWWKV